jgi:hypothetical protein
LEGAYRSVKAAFGIALGALVHFVMEVPESKQATNEVGDRDVA